MRLIPDLVRDLLMYVEEDSSFSGPHNVLEGEYLSFGEIPYPAETVFYHIRYCEQAGLIHGVFYADNRPIAIQDLTPAGHEFLANIRDPKNWNETKTIASKVGSFGLKILETIAAGVAEGAVKGLITK